MHLRRRGNSVQIVKTMVEPETGKTVSKPVGSANLNTGEIGPTAVAALSATEAEEVKTWIARRRVVEAQRQELAYRMLADHIGEVAGWVQTADPALVAEYAEEVRDSMMRLRRALGLALAEEGTQKAA